MIDVDVSDAAVDALAGALDQRFPELFAHGLVRHAGGAKEAWIARVEEPFRRLASRRWYRGSDPDDPACPSTWSNASVRSERGSSRSTGRMPAARAK